MQLGPPGPDGSVLLQQNGSVVRLTNPFPGQAAAQQAALAAAAKQVTVYQKFCSGPSGF